MKAKLIGKSLVAASVAVTALFCSVDLSTTPSLSFTSSAQAWVGAPATPRSFAGVARRTTRRSVAAGVAVGATAATVGAVTYGAAAAASNCVRVVGPYGRAAVVCR